MAKTHVPKFGNWDNGKDIPYTAYFEGARRERSARALHMNPNDPEQNPEAFSFLSSGKDYHHDPSMGSSSNQYTNTTSESGGDGKNHPAGRLLHRPKNHRRNGVAGAGTISLSSFAASSDNSSFKQRSGRSRSAKDNNKGRQRSGSIPKFGAWDENDPTSGEGFTFIFQRARKDKESPFSVAAEPPIPETSARTTPRTSFLKSKACCCLFPDKRD